MTAIGAALTVAVLSPAVMACGPTTSPPASNPGSVYRVEIEPCLGLSTQRATAFAVDASADPSSLVLFTAAHSFERASGAVIRDTDGGVRPASVVVLDLAKDIAVLRIDGNGSDEAVFALEQPVADSSVEVLTFSDIEGPEIKTGTVNRLVDASLDGEGRRRAVELASIDIHPGDSGAPVVNHQGEVVAMVFAAARSGDRAWANSSVELEDALALALDPSTEPDGLSCSRDPSIETERR